jgi:hypothetical protein
MPNPEIISDPELVATQPQPEVVDTTPEFVESFVDSEGVERSAERPEVMLDKEAREAIDSFFVEHHQYADSIQETIVMTREMEELGGIGLGPPLLFAKISTPESLEKQLAQAEARSHGESESGQSILQETAPKTPLAIEVEKILNDRARIAELEGLSLESTEFADIKAFVDALPESVKVEIKEATQSGELPEVKGVKLRLSKEARETLVESINSAIDRAQRSAEAANNGNADEIFRLIEAGFVEALKSGVEGVEPYNPEDGPNEDLLREHLNRNIFIEHSPSQNEAHLTELQPDIRAVTDAMQAMDAAQGLALAFLSSPETLEAIKLIDRSYLLARLAEKSKELEELKDFNFEQACERARFLSKAVDERLRDAIGTVFQERALPIYYMSDKERERAEELIALYNNNPAGRPLPNDLFETTLQKTKEKVKVTAAAQAVCHTTGFAQQIIERGAIMPKQTQIDEFGTIHEQQMGDQSRGQIPGVRVNHSTVPHFSAGYIDTYAINDEKASPRGLFLVPLGAMVEQAPYGTDGRRLKVLPEVEGGRHSSEITAIKELRASHDDDLVFYSSATDWEHSDDYKLPLSEMGIVVIDGGYKKMNIPEELASQTVVIPYTERLSKIPVELAKAVGTLQKRFDSKYAGQVVVPLREGGLTFNPEVPKSELRQSKYRGGREFRSLDVSKGVSVTRNNSAYTDR